MKKYNVKITMYYLLENIEAESEEEAKDIAFEMINDSDTGYDYSDEEIVELDGDDND